MENTTRLHQLKDACRNVCKDRFPQEGPFFEVVWDNYWQISESMRAEGFHDSAWGEFENPVFHMGAGGRHSGQVLDTLFVIGVLSDATNELIRLEAERKIHIGDIEESLMRSSSRKGIPEHVLSILAEQGLQLVAKIFGLSTIPNSEAPRADGSRVLWVELFDHEAERMETVKVKTGFFDESEISEWERDDYRLFIDERSPGVFVKPKGTDKASIIGWHELSAQESTLLGMYLDGMRTRTSLSFAYLIEKIPGRGETGFGIDHVRLRVVKSNLHGKLLGILDDYVVANKGYREYLINGQFPYCWVRKEKSTSRLLVTDRQQNETEF